MKSKKNYQHNLNLGKIMVNKIYVKQIRSPIRRPEIQRKILKGLGLNKMNKISELVDTPAIRGMINKIKHLVQVVEK